MGCHNGEALATRSGHNGDVSCLAYSPDRKQIASGSEDKSVIIWEASTGKIVAKLAGHQANITCLDFSPNGRRIATASNQTLKIWTTP